MPLNSTEPPVDRPVTGSGKTTRIVAVTFDSPAL
jgi:hypothetical protein